MIDEEALTEHVRKFLQDQEDNYLFYTNAELFASLRLHHLLTSLSSVAELETDNLIPKDILRVLMVDQWKTLLSNEENPKRSATLLSFRNIFSAFPKFRTRTSISRVYAEVEWSKLLRKPGDGSVSTIVWMWWSTTAEGRFPLSTLYSSRTFSLITLKRNCFHTSTPYSVNLKTDRVIHYRLVVCNSDCKTIFDSGKKELTLQHDQVVNILLYC